MQTELIETEKKLITVMMREPELQRQVLKITKNDGVAIFYDGDNGHVVTVFQSGWIPDRPYIRLTDRTPEKLRDSLSEMMEMCDSNYL